jgi:hypothetical protein
MRARSPDPLYPSRGRSVWQRREHELGVCEQCVVVRHEAHIDATQPGTLATALVRRSEREFERRVTRNDRAELAPGVSARSEYSNRNSMHKECILLQRGEVNRC